jgi:FkbM family methyltransferase
MTIEIAEFLKNIQRKTSRPFFILGDRERKALGLLMLFLKKKISLRELFWMLQPVTKRPPEISLKRQKLINEDIESYLFKNKVLNKDKSLNLFGKHFYYINLEDALGSINQIIVNDEYNLKDFLKEDFVVFDIGSNIGVFACFAANLVKKGKVFAFEPVSFVFDFLKKNTIDYDNVECYKIGFGLKIEEKEILIRQWTPGDSTIQDSPIDRPHQSFDLKEKIEILTLDIFVKEKKLEKIDFIKIDVEGYEIKVLEGGIESIKKFRPILGISLHNQLFEKEIRKIFEKKLKITKLEKAKKIQTIFFVYQNERKS